MFRVFLLLKPQTPSTTCTTYPNISLSSALQAHPTAQHKPLNQSDSLPVQTSPGTMANIANTKNVAIADNKGLVGADNSIDVQGGAGKASLGNVNEVLVGGTNDGKIGAENQYGIKGGLKDGDSIGNVSQVAVGQNLGSIGAGNKINIS
ncbi:uncharacterized protein AB9X84_018662 isoform 1-T1 [Acanthopagrus schlegelii]